MLFSFIYKYKKKLKEVSEEYDLKCKWLKNKNFLVRHFFIFDRYFRYLKKGEGVPQSLFKKVHDIQEKYYSETDCYFLYWETYNMPKDKLEEMLCSWVALAYLIGVDEKDFVEDKLESADLPLLSKRYLLNKLT